MTPQRRLMEDIIHDAESHLTAEAVTDYVQSNMPDMHKSVIYLLSRFKMRRRHFQHIQSSADGGFMHSIKIPTSTMANEAEVFLFPCNHIAAVRPRSCEIRRNGIYFFFHSTRIQLFSIQVKILIVGGKEDEAGWGQHFKGIVY
jgi:hypothetical protein